MSMDLAPWKADGKTASRLVLVEQRSLHRHLLLDWLHLAWPGCRIDAVAEAEELDNDPAPILLALFSFGDSPVRAPHITASIRSLLGRIHKAPLVLLGERHDRADVADALAIGARGYLPASLDSPAAARAIEFVLAGGVFVPAEAVVEPGDNGHGRNGADRHGRLPQTRRDFDDTSILRLLTPRERAVAELVCAGKPNKIIAHELHISESTVKVFVRQILSKLGATNRTEAASAIRRLLEEAERRPSA